MYKYNRILLRAIAFTYLLPVMFDSIRCLWGIPLRNPYPQEQAPSQSMRLKLGPLLVGLFHNICAIFITLHLVGRTNLNGRVCGCVNVPVPSLEFLPELPRRLEVQASYRPLLGVLGVTIVNSWEIFFKCTLQKHTWSSLKIVTASILLLVNIKSFLTKEFLHWEI